MNERLRAYANFLKDQAPSKEELERRLEQAKEFFEFVSDPIIIGEIAKKDPLHVEVAEIYLCDLDDEITGGKDKLWIQISTHLDDMSVFIVRKRDLDIKEEELKQRGLDKGDIEESASNFVREFYPSFELLSSRSYKDSFYGTVAQLLLSDQVARLYGSQIDSVIVPALESLLIPQKE